MSGSDNKEKSPLIINVQVDASRYLEGSFDEQFDAEITGRVSKALTNELAPLIRAKIEGKVIDIVEKKITENMDAFVQEHDVWGNPKGEPARFNDYVMKNANQWLKERVDPQSGKRDAHYNQRNSVSRITYLFAEEIRKFVEAHFSDKKYSADFLLKTSEIRELKERVTKVISDFAKQHKEKIEEGIE